VHWLKKWLKTYLFRKVCKTKPKAVKWSFMVELHQHTAVCGRVLFGNKIKYMWCKKCLWVLALAALWGALSTYWYMCKIKGVCDMSMAAPVAEAPIAQPAVKAVVVTPVTAWNEVAAEPLVVYFGADGDNVLTEGVDAKLKAIVAYMQQNGGARISVTGHTNVHSNNEYTMKLGQSRADKLKSLLVSYGAPTSAIETNSRGQSMLAAPATTQAGQALNRRAVVSIIK
jgi:outer membrane protein OmpA-like peptidoglycan-associated protein